jgi:SOS-response transcriptional repressor LexA
MKPENLFALAKATGFRAEWLAIGEGPERDEPAQGHSNVRPVSVPDTFYRYPRLSSVAAGSWREAVEAFDPWSWEDFEITGYQSKGSAFWLQVDGDSMTSTTPPSFPDGTLILVDTGIIPRAGHMVVARLHESNEATFKQLAHDAGRMFLKPLNPAYPLIPIDERCDLIGVVVEQKSRLRV